MHVCIYDHMVCIVVMTLARLCGLFLSCEAIYKNIMGLLIMYLWVSEVSLVGTMYILASSITRFTFIVLRNTGFLVWYRVVCIKLPVAICIWWCQVLMCTNAGNNNMALEVIRGDLNLHLVHMYEKLHECLLFCR